MTGDCSGLTTRSEIAAGHALRSLVQEHTRENGKLLLLRRTRSTSVLSEDILQRFAYTAFGGEAKVLFGFVRLSSSSCD